jgi:hypothetical protein
VLHLRSRSTVLRAQCSGQNGVRVLESGVAMVKAKVSARAENVTGCYRQTLASNYNN